jgi:REP element-mobilizing transposase RayT
MPHRRRNSLRLEGYDYTLPGGYFVTINTYRNESVLGMLSDGRVSLSNQGMIANTVWLNIPSHFHHVTLDAFVILPDHIHGILLITTQTWNNVDPKTNGRKLAAGSLSAVVRSYKSAVTKTVNEIQKTPGRKLWQRNFHDRIIRNDKSLQRIRQYIQNNPKMHWNQIRGNTTAS